MSTLAFPQSLPVASAEGLRSQCRASPWWGRVSLNELDLLPCPLRPTPLHFCTISGPEPFWFCVIMAGVLESHFVGLNPYFVIFRVRQVSIPLQASVSICEMGMVIHTSQSCSERLK